MALYVRVDRLLETRSKTFFSDCLKKGNVLLSDAGRSNIDQLQNIILDLLDMQFL